MVDIIDVTLISITGVVLYVTFLFVILFFRNKSEMNLIPKTSRLPSVSFIIPAHNEERKIKSCIENLKNLNYPKHLLEIIVVDDHSTDRTAEIAKKCGVKVLTSPKQGKVYALNHAIKNAKSEIIAVVDADSYPEKDSLLKSVSFFEEKDVMAITTKILVKNDDNFLTRIQAIEYALIAWSRKLSEYIEGIYVTPGPFALYRKSIFNKIGYFDPKNATEDIEIAWRILSRGYKIRMSPAKSYTFAPEKWKTWVKQRLRWNIGGFQTTAKYKSYIFRKGSSSFKFYILPFFSLSYFVTFLSLSLFIYLIYYWIYSNATFIINAFLVGINPFSHYSFSFIPNIFTYFGIILFASAVALIYVGMTGIKMGQKNWVYIAFYLTFYITIFPFLFAYSVIQYARGYNEW